MLRLEPDMEAVAEAKNGVEAIELFRLHQPNVALMDLRMPKMRGVEAITTLRQESPDASIIVTTYDGDEAIYRGLQAGAKGYLLKDTSCVKSGVNTTPTFFINSRPYEGTLAFDELMQAIVAARPS